MRSVRTEAFNRLFRRPPLSIQRQAVFAHRHWRENPGLPGLRHKRVGTADPLYSVRINDDFRAGRGRGVVLDWAA